MIQKDKVNMLTIQAWCKSGYNYLETTSYTNSLQWNKCNFINCKNELLDVLDTGKYLGVPFFKIMGDISFRFIKLDGFYEFAKGFERSQLSLFKRSIFEYDKRPDLEYNPRNDHNHLKNNNPCDEVINPCNEVSFTSIQQSIAHNNFVFYKIQEYIKSSQITCLSKKISFISIINKIKRMFNLRHSKIISESKELIIENSELIENSKSVKSSNIDLI